ncbi:MAG: hypothetical protein LBJ20_03715 [Candidatus Methanoplasma sp.]|jgi:hypothetical protein|nr:hypothetical protein [Candidatus Methanoplasma sp.]
MTTKTATKTDNQISSRDQRKEQRAQNRVDRDTAKTARQKTKAQKEINKTELKKQKGYSHGFSFGVWNRRGKEIKPAKDKPTVTLYVVVDQDVKPTKSSRGKK